MSKGTKQQSKEIYKRNYLRFFQKSYPTSAKMSSKRVGKTAADTEATAVPEEVQDTGLNPAVAERSSRRGEASPVKDTLKLGHFFSFG